MLLQEGLNAGLTPKQLIDPMLEGIGRTVAATNIPPEHLDDLVEAIRHQLDIEVTKYVRRPNRIG